MSILRHLTAGALVALALCSSMARAETPPVLELAPPVGLTEILAHADEHAPAVRVARARLGLGEAALAGARPALPGNPEISAAVGPRFIDDGLGLDFQISAMQPIPLSAQRRQRRTAAEGTRDRVQAELAAVQWQTHWEVHAAYHRALVHRERRRAAAALLAFQERLLRVSQSRLAVGETGPLPVRIAEGEAARARVAMLAAEQSYRAAILALSELAGWPANRPFSPAGELDQPLEAPQLAEIEALARRFQPSLRSLEAAVAEARSYLELARREAAPRASVGVQVGREDEDGRGGDINVLGAVSIELPFVQRNQAERAMAGARLGVAEAEQAAYEQTLSLVLTRAKSAVDAAAAQLAVYGSEILPSFEENLRLIERAYELGEIDILDVSVARERFLRLQSDALDAYITYYEAVATLESIVGTELWPGESHE